MGIEQVAKPSTNQETADSSLTNHRTVSGQLDLWWGVGGGKGNGVNAMTKIIQNIL